MDESISADQGEPSARPPNSVKAASREARDPRIDLLRGLALICIFCDHIPYNCMSFVSLWNFGFSDAAEVFVLLAGFSATLAYGRVFDRDGAPAGLRKVLRRCAAIYATQVALCFVTMGVVSLRTALTGTEPMFIGPLLSDGLDGVVRVITLQALPTYLDILPLYLLLLLGFPAVLYGVRTSIPVTIGLSLALYLLANRLHLNLPNHIGRSDTATWYFNPFAWQIIYVAGAALAAARQTGDALFTAPPRLLILSCAVYLVFALGVAVMADGPPQALLGLPVALFGNDPKSFVSPWRLVHVLALIYLVLVSARLDRVARLPLLQPVVICGRRSLSVFATGCVLALFGRMLFRSLGHGPAMQVLVNTAGVFAMCSIGALLNARAARPENAKAAVTLVPEAQAA